MKLLLPVAIFILCFTANANQYELFEVQGKVGLKDESGKIVLPASFESLGWSDGSFSVINQVTGYKINDQWGLVNLNKEFVTKPMYESVTNSGGYLVIAQKKVNPVEVKSGCINLKGEVAIPFLYDGIKLNALQAIVFRKIGSVFRYGLIGLNNEVIIPMEYARVSALSASRYAVENTKGQTAIFSDQGKFVIEFSIDSISAYRQNYAVFYQGFHQGLIDREGNILIGANYTKVAVREDGSVAGRLPSECQILSGKNGILNTIEADGLTNSYGHLYKIQRGKLFGLCDDQLKSVFSPQYQVLTETTNNQFIAKKENYGLIRKDNSMILPFIFDSLLIDGSLIRAKEKSVSKNAWALYDTLGNKKTQSNYEWIDKEKDNYFAVKKRGYWGIISSTGEELIHCVYDSIVNHEGGSFAVRLRNEYGVINAREDWLMAPQLQAVKLLTPNRILTSNGLVNFIKDLTGNIIYFSESRLEFTPPFIIEKLANGTERKLDYDGRVIEQPAPVRVEQVEIIFQESEGLRGIKKDGKFGFIDKRGNLRVANRYDAILPFKEGLAAVKLNNKWGYIDSDERIMIQPSFEFTGSFEQGQALVRRNNKYGLINKSGKVILNIQYDSLYALPEKSLLLVNNKLKGLANKEGKVIVEPKFDELTDLNNGYLIAKRDGKFGLITLEGLSTIPLAYNQLIYNARNKNYLVMKVAEWQTIMRK